MENIVHFEIALFSNLQSEFQKLINVLISQFDKDYNFVKLINAKEVNIKDMNWKIYNAVITENSLSVKSKEVLLP